MYCFGEAYEVGVWGEERAACVAGEFVWRARDQTSDAGVNERWTARKRIFLAASLLARAPLPLPFPNKIRELKQRRRRRQRERQKRFRSAKQQLCTYITLFCTFLSRRCTNTTLKYLISCFVEDGNTRQQLSFSFPELWNSPLEITSKKLANLWRIKRDGINTIKFEAAQIYFLSDVFVAVAVIVALAPYCQLSRVV